MRLRAGGHGVNLKRTGPEGAPAVVLIHGLAASLDCWDQVAGLLEDRFDVIRYDLRSHGASEAVDEPCTRSDLAADLVAILDGLGLECAALFGHSGGGVVAMQTAVDHPGRTSALVLVGTASECNDRAAGWYRKTAEIARAEGGLAAMREMRLSGSGQPVPDGNGLAHVSLAMSTLNEDPLTEPMRSVVAPTLVVVGEKDFLGVGGSVILSRAVAGSELEIIPERGHGLHLEWAEGLAGRAGDFLDASLAA